MEYKVMLILEVNAESPLEAAKVLADWTQNKGAHSMVYEVIDEEGETHMVDLQEEQK